MIEVRQGVLHVYGNRAGRVEDDHAVVDTMFATPELSGWLSDRWLDIEWREGVYDELQRASDAAGTADLKRVRIWQLRNDVDPLRKFISYDTMLRDFGEPLPEDYAEVFDGALGTNDLDEIFEIFNVKHPEGFTGHSLSMSDVVELYGDDGSEYHYVDRFGFKQIAFGEASPTLEMT